MQDDNTVQPNDTNAAGDTVVEDNVVEPTLSLGINPAEQPATDPDVPVTDDPTIQPVTDDTATGSDDQSDDSGGADVGSEDSDSSDSSQSADLESIKSSALHELTPIIGELDQEPEEKYRTLMMMIQASDDQSLVKEAYEAAGKIEDKKAKAEALLTIVNEINYLTGKDKSQPED